MKRNQYDESFKTEAISLVLSGELSHVEVARDLGVNYKTLCNWIRATMKNPKPTTAQSKNPSKQDYQALDNNCEPLKKNLSYASGRSDSKKGQRVLCQPETVRYAMIAQEPVLSIARKCAIMNVSRSGYYDWRKREVSLRELANTALDAQIQTIYHDHAGRYGYRRVCEELRDMGLYLPH